MPCFKPLLCYRKRSGGITFSHHEAYVDQPMKVPCGQCVGCRLDRSRQWAVRCMHEASLYELNTFITLTYDNEHLPDGNTLVKKHFQDFMKRLRFKYSETTIRFYMCGEYGENFGRPHYHAILFNHDFLDRTYWQESKSGEKIYRSKDLEKLWPMGFSSVGNVSIQSAAYVARYVMKKITGDNAADHYKGRVPEYNTMSLRPGVANDWFEKYHPDVFPHDYVVVQDGKKMATPKYYLKQLEKKDPKLFECVKQKRRKKAKELNEENSPERLQVKENIQKRRLSLLKRNIA